VDPVDPDPDSDPDPQHCFRASLFHDNLSKENTFSQIHLAGQFLDTDLKSARNSAFV
jgi:hypothetical protein